MDVTKIVRPKTLGDLIVTEYNSNFCRERKTLLAGSGSARVIAMFTVLGRKFQGAQTVGAAVAIGTNVGNGAFGTPTADSDAMPGDWTVEVVEPATDAGKIIVRKPDGTIDGHGNVASAYNGGINFTIADATDFAAGDMWKVNVSYAALDKYAALDFTDTNGLQTAAAIALVDTTAPDGTDVPIDVLSRGPAIVRADHLVWPGGATTDQKAAALVLLEAKGIVARTSG